MKAIFSILIFISCCNHSFSQTLESALFEQACRSILRDDSLLKLTSKLEDVHILEDPVTGEWTIRFPPKPLTKEAESFSQLDKTEQRKILLTDFSLPIFPLAKTVLIIDTLEQFPESEFSLAGVNFKLQHEWNSSIQQPDTRTMFIWRVRFRKNDIGILYSFVDSYLMYSLDFRLQDSKMILLKSSTFDKRAIHE
jgi:hypothetical protein